LPTIWNGSSDLSTFMLWISPNLAKYSYGWSSLEQHHKYFYILKKTLNVFVISSIIIFSQIWSRKSQAPLHIIGKCGNFWLLKFFKINFLAIFFFKQQGLYNSMLFF
jgi:hypothetical protein